MGEITVRKEYQISANEIMKLHRLSRSSNHYKKAYAFIMRVLDSYYEIMTSEQKECISSILDDIR